MPFFVYSRLRLSWGFSVRPPARSQGGPSLPLPPPSTIAGALAASLSRLLGWGEYYLDRPSEAVRRGRGRKAAGALVVYSTAYRLARHLLGVGARLEPTLALWEEPVRYATLPYQKPVNLRDPGVWFSVPAFGSTVAPGATVLTSRPKTS